MLTKKQREVYDFIKKFISQNGYPPSRVEIADCLKVYPNSAQNHVHALARLGYIEVTKGVSRGIRITRKVPREV